MFGEWWSNPYAWTLDKICELRDRFLTGDQEAIAQLAAMAMLMAAELDHDQLQDLFQNAMENNGYFDGEQDDSRRSFLGKGEHW